MHRLKHLCFLLLISSFPERFSAQTETYSWEEGLSIYHAQFDSKKYSHQEIDLIYDYLLNPPRGLFEIGNVWNIAQIKDSITTTELDSFYWATIGIYRIIKTPETDFWKDLIVQRKNELNEWYLAKSVFLKSFHTPEILPDKNYPECSSDSKALSGTENELLLAWSQLHEIQKKNNCCPEEIEKKYQAEFNSEDKLLYARLAVTVYSWWNCRNSYIHHVNDDTGLILKEFVALFSLIEIEQLKD